MASLLDLIDPAVLNEGAAPAVPEGEFSKGLRSGANTAGSQLNNVAAAIGQAVGAPEFARGRLAAADEYRTAAGNAAPRVGSYRDVHGLRDAGDYVAGLAGGMLPIAGAVAGAGLLTGGRALPAMAAGTGVMAPLETGDVLQRQRDQGREMSLREAAPTGLASAALQNVIPGLARAKLAGKMPAGSAASNLAMIPEQAALGAGGEAVKQYGAQEQINPEQIGEAAVGSAVMGVPFAAMGAAGGARAKLGSAVQAVSEAPSKALEAAKSAVGSAKDAIEAPSASQAAADGLSGVVEGAKKAARTAVDRVAEGFPVDAEAAKALAGKTGPALTEALGKLDNDTTRAVAGWAKELSEDAGLTPERRAKLAEFMQDMGSEASQRGIAALRKGQDVAAQAGRAVDGLRTAVADWAGKAADKLDGGPKKSEDFAGVRKAISEHLIPALQEVNPGVLDNERNISVVADSVRLFMEQTAKGKPVPESVMVRLSDLLGDRANETLDTIHRAVYGDDRKKAEGFFGALNQMREMQKKGETQLHQVLQKNLKKEHQGAFTTHEMRDQADILAQWAGRTDDGTERSRHYDALINDHIDTHFDNPDVVRKAIERQMKERAPVLEAESPDSPAYAEVMNEDGPQRARVSEKLVAKPEAHRAEYGNEGQAERMIRETKAKHPGIEARWMSADEYHAEHGGESVAKDSGLGYVVAERMAGSDKLTAKQAAAFKFDSSKGDRRTSKNVIDAGEGLQLDAMKLGRQRGGEELPWNAADDKGNMVRLSRQFMNNVAAVQEHLGRAFEIPDDTVVALRGKVEITAGELKKLGQSTEERSGLHEGEAPDQRAKRLARQMNAIENLARTEERLKEAKGPARDALKEDIAELKERAGLPPKFPSFDREALADAYRRLHTDAGAAESADRLSTHLERDRGITEVSDERVPIQTLEAMGKVELHKTNMDGTPVGSSLGGGANARLRAGKQAVRDADQAPAQSEDAGKKARITAKLDNMLAKEDFGSLDTRQKVDAFLAHAKERYAELQAEDKRILADDDHPTGRLPETQQKALYKLEDMFGRDAKTDLESFYDGVPSDPKVVAAKKAAFLEKARSGDTELLKTLASSDDAKGLQRAVEALSKEKGEGVQRTVEAINKRLGELVRSNPDVAYGMQLGKKYSLMSLQVHEDLGRPGFAATHDSPIRHEGKFNWREHEGKGEGAAAFGAGTYLSTGDTVHSFYKKSFAAKVMPEYEYQAADRIIHQLHKAIGKRTEVASDAAKIAASKGKDEAIAFVKRTLDKHLEEGPEGTISQAEFDKWTGVYEKLLSAITAMSESEMRPKSVNGYRPNKSPTYHVSVDIEPSELLNWDKPLSKQSPSVKLRAVKAIEEQGIKYAKHEAFEDDVWGSFDAKTERLKMTGEELYKALTEKLGSQRAASDYLQKLGILGHEYAAANGKDAKAPNYVIYDDSRINTNYVHFDKTSTDPNNANTSGFRKDTLDHINKVLGPTVQVAFKKFADMPHAGEFERVMGPHGVEDIIRISVHALNPLSTARHETLHAWFQQLSDKGLHQVMRPLLKAADTEHVQRQLRALLANEPDALKQLTNAEERVAYMYQFWADGRLRIPQEPRNVFERVAQFFREVLGIWSNDQRAQHILEYFNDGKYAADRSPSAVTRATLEAGRNQALTKLKEATQPLTRLADEVGSAGAARLRDTGIPALREMADLMKATGRAGTDDKGFIPAARVERSRVMNSLGEALGKYSNTHITEALEAMQRDQRATSLEARTVQAIVRKTLRDSLKYMQDAGVRTGDLGPDYFPRVYDPSYISRNQKAFLDVLSKHGVANPAEVMHKIVSADGNEFQIETMKPGMQNLKQRSLGFIPNEELAPFMRKNLYETLNSYITQATRRAEWARRMGDDGRRVRELLDQAAAQGATKADMSAAERYVRAVDGTLGDNINPTARRLMGDMIVYQNVRLLPLAIFSSVVDPLGIMVRGGTVGDAFTTFKRGIKETVKNFQKDPTRDHSTELAETLGIIDNATLVHTLGALYSQGMVGDTGRKINDTFFRYNLMEQFNTSMRVGAMEAGMRFIQRHADGTASKHSARWMEELGLTQADVKLDAAGRLDVSDPKVRMAINQWVDGAVLRPDAADKPIWMNDPHWALVAHLKQFVYSFHETILKRVAHEAQHGNYNAGMALASYVPVMIASDLAKGLIQGGGSQPEWKDKWTAEDYIWSGVQRGGLLGTGQFLADMAGDIKEGGIGVGALAGPTIEQFADAVRLLEGREQFKHFVIKSLPANALYAHASGGVATDPKFTE